MQMTSKSAVFYARISECKFKYLTELLAGIYVISKSIYSMARIQIICMLPVYFISNSNEILNANKGSQNVHPTIPLVPLTIFII